MLRHPPNFCYQFSHVLLQQKIPACRPILPNTNHECALICTHTMAAQCPSTGRPNVLAAVVAPSSLASSFVGSKILPGFINQCGSSALLILRMTSIVGVPSSCSREAFLPKPLQVSGSVSLISEPKDKSDKQKTLRGIIPGSRNGTVSKASKQKTWAKSLAGSRVVCWKALGDGRAWRENDFLRAPSEPRKDSSKRRMTRLGGSG